MHMYAVHAMQQGWDVMAVARAASSKSAQASSAWRSSVWLIIIFFHCTEHSEGWNSCPASAVAGGLCVVMAFPVMVDS